MWEEKRVYGISSLCTIGIPKKNVISLQRDKDLVYNIYVFSYFDYMIELNIFKIYIITL